MIAASSSLSQGSSPLTRGKLGRASDVGDLGRLIPAHAGKTKRLELQVPGDGAHPRSRGENVDVGRQSVIVSGLIPAHAGKTQARQWKRWVPSAHPRSRGENQ